MSLSVKILELLQVMTFLDMVPATLSLCERAQLKLPKSKAIHQIYKMK